MGFEPTRAEHIGLAVQRLNHSATVSVVTKQIYDLFQNNIPIPSTSGVVAHHTRALVVRLKSLKKLSKSKFDQISFNESKSLFILKPPYFSLKSKKTFF